MTEDRPERTTCDRCGATIRYRHGPEPTYCDGCHAAQRPGHRYR